MQRMHEIAAFRQWQRRVRSELDSERQEIAICGGTGCLAFGSHDVRKSLEVELARRGLTGDITVKMTGCHGFCEQGPVVVIKPEGVFYPGVKVEDVP
ncbi:MAG: (2Fe-2S) ferredoxin domain-containing protein, partial [Candidatus Brocadiia bacterium]|nr:(2Fe-2S) ferredoxin domain-containing protein [Candidatus Brocadiia bacterium]